MRVAALAAILVAAGVVYSNTFDVPFTFDDDEHLVEGTLGRSVWGALSACGQQNRCVGFASFALNYAADGLEVRGYHVVNLVIHAGAGLLVYALALLLARTPRLRGRWPGVDWNKVAVGAALLFVVHPLQTMAVTYVVQRFASLMALFYLAAVVAWLAARLRPNGAGRWGLFAVSLVAAALAMKTKENAVTLPVALALLELTCFEGPRLPRLARLAPWVLTLVLPAAVTFGGAAGEGGVDAALRANTSMSRLAFVSTELTVVPAYLRLLVLPVGQSIEHSPPLYETPWQLAPLLGAVLLGALLVAALRFVRRREPGLVLAGFGVLWFFLTLSVESTVLPIKDVMVEHRLYLPSAGLFVAVAAGWAFVFERVGRARVGGLVAAAVVVGLGVAAFARNAVWRDELELWQQAIARASNAPLRYAHTNAGKALLESGRCAEAVQYFEAAHASDGTQLVPLLNLGVCHAQLGDRARARQRYEEAMALDPGDSRAPTQLARLALEDGDLVTARALFERALTVTPSAAEVRAALGATLGQLGLLDEARSHLERAVAEAPGSAMAWGNLGNVRSLQADVRGAEEAWRRALACDPSDAAARENLARLLAMQGAR